MAKQQFIVYTGRRQFKLPGEKHPRWLDSWLADTTERTSPVVAHTRTQSEAVRLTKQEAEDESWQVNGKVQKA